MKLSEIWSNSLPCLVIDRRLKTPSPPVATFHLTSHHANALFGRTLSWKKPTKVFLFVVLTCNCQSHIFKLIKFKYKLRHQYVSILFLSQTHKMEHHCFLCWHPHFALWKVPSSLPKRLSCLSSECWSLISRNKFLITSSNIDCCWNKTFFFAIVDI